MVQRERDIEAQRESLPINKSKVLSVSLRQAGVHVTTGHRHGSVESVSFLELRPFGVRNEPP